jgi:hypothetical protein
MARWHQQHLRDLANEAQAKALAARDNIGQHYTWAGVPMIAWPNGEVSEEAEYDHWLAGRRLAAQYGEHG